MQNSPMGFAQTGGMFSKANVVRLLLVLCMFLVFNFLIFFIDNKSVNLSMHGAFSKLSIRKAHHKLVARKHENSSRSGEPHSWLSTTAAVATESIEHVVLKQTINLTKCSDPDLDDRSGPLTPNTTLESLETVELKLGPLLRPGGAFQPANCSAVHHVAIIVPFRDRYAHLSIFLQNIHPFLMQQNIAYRIFIVEQTNGKPFNRAALMNIGFLEALKIYPWDCFIFHDVDLLPTDHRNLYTCPRQPRHMSVAIDTLKFKLPYITIFGGVSAMRREHFQAVNGFSNSFFGWGGEDDDMSNRLKHSNLYISRYPFNIARYMMLKHQKEKANPKRFENLVSGINRMESDGINSIKYEIYSKKEFALFTWYLTEIKIPYVKG